MDLYRRFKKKSSNKIGKINLNCIILICYLISFFTNISFFFIYILSKYIYKWFGFIFISIELILLIISIKRIQNLKKTNFDMFTRISNALMIILLLNSLFFLIISIYIIVKEISPDLIAIFICCCIIWCIFHGLFISILRYYIIHKKFSKNKALFNYKKV